MKLMGLLMAVFPLVSVAATPVSLDRAIKMALKSSEEVQVKKGEEQKSKYRYFEAKGALLPKVTYEAQWTRNFGAPTAYDIGDPSKDANPLSRTIHIANNYELAHTVQLAQPLFTFGQIYHGINAAKKGYQVSKFDVEAKKREVIYNTKVAYYSVLLSQELLEIKKRSLNNARSNKRLLKERFSRGRPPQSDNIRMAADVATRVPQVKDAEVQLESATLNFKMILDIKEDVQLTDVMTDQFRELDYQVLVDAMEKVEPRKKMLDAVVTASDFMIKQKKASFFPTLGAFAAYKYFGSSDDLAVGSGNMDDIFAVGVQLTFPLWTGGQKISQYKQAVADRATAVAQKRQVNKGLSLQLRNAYSQYKMYLAIYKANLEAERLAGQSFQMSRNRFKTGNTSVTELNDVERGLTGAKMQKVVTLFNIHKVNALIEMLTMEKI